MAADPDEDPYAAFEEMLLSHKERQKRKRVRARDAAHGRGGGGVVGDDGPDEFVIPDGGGGDPDAPPSEFSTSRKRQRQLAPGELQRVLNKHKPGYKLRGLPRLRVSISDADWTALSPRDPTTAAFVHRVVALHQWRVPGRAFVKELDTSGPVRRLVEQESGGRFQTHLNAILLPLAQARRGLLAPTSLQTALLTESIAPASPLVHLNLVLSGLQTELGLILGALYLFPIPRASDGGGGGGTLVVLVAMFAVLPDGALAMAQAPAVALAFAFMTPPTTTTAAPQGDNAFAPLCIAPWPAADDDHVEGMPQAPTPWASTTLPPTLTRVVYHGCALLEPRFVASETTPVTHYARFDPRGQLHAEATA